MIRNLLCGNCCPAPELCSFHNHWRHEANAAGQLHVDRSLQFCSQVVYLVSFTAQGSQKKKTSGVNFGASLVLFHCKTPDNKKWEVYSDLTGKLQSWWWQSPGHVAVQVQGTVVPATQSSLWLCLPTSGHSTEVPAWLLVSNSSSRAGEELQAGPFKPQKQKSPQGISNLLYRWTSAVLNYCHGKGLKSYFCMCLFGWQKRAIWAQRNMELLYTALKREFSLCLIFKS